MQRNLTTHGPSFAPKESNQILCSLHMFYKCSLVFRLNNFLLLKIFLDTPEID